MILLQTDRTSPTYHNFFYPETYPTDRQSQTITELSRNPPKLVIIQKPGLLEPEANFQNTRLVELINYLDSGYHLVDENTDFWVLSRVSRVDNFAPVY